MLESLNERDDVENSEEDGKLQGGEPEFDVNDRSQTIQIDQPLLQQARALAAIPPGQEIGEITPPSNNIFTDQQLVSPIATLEEEKMAD